MQFLFKCKCRDLRSNLLFGFDFKKNFEADGGAWEYDCNDGCCHYESGFSAETNAENFSAEIELVKTYIAENMPESNNSPEYDEFELLDVEVEYA